ncbi:hypothetical protein [Cellulomonas phragmiteti]|uniref:Phenylalanyl-tRNA synthetase beta subunit n=1 Tax=Cellulomonas phragmiteti TaxID=478780 RepID=A0ABQ4DR38_9CELL|nr:hypothetical protein [Cellulomonas phragmiteti]GIG41799.1 hypothetical protein Cph01nite_35610 [Cellulomonas phragmiteti]
MRVPLSWLNDLLVEPVSARVAAEALGDAGLTVSRVEGVGAASPHVVVGEVVSVDADGAVVRVPTCEPVRVPASVGPLRPGARVAVAMAGALLPDDAPSGTVRVPRSGAGAVLRVGEVCRARDLGGDGGAAVPLPPDASLGAPVAPLLPAAAGDTVLTLRVPGHLPHARSLAGLAAEVAARAGTSVVPDEDPPASGLRAAPLAVATADVEAAAVLVPEPAPGAVDPQVRRRLQLAGLRPDGPLVAAVRAVAYRTGVRITLHPSSPGPLRLAVHADGPPGSGPHHVDGVRPPVPGEPPTWVVVATAVRGARPGPAAALREVCHAVGADPVHAAAGGGPDGPRRVLVLDLAATARRTGLTLGADEVARLVARVDARAEPDDDGRVRVTVPPSRPDLRDEVALADELVRLAGVGDVVASWPAPLHRRPEAPRRTLEQRVRRALLGEGRQELVTSLVTRADAPTGEDDVPLVPGDGPRAAVRSDLAVDLARRAAARPDGGRVRVFEVGGVVSRDGRERRVAAIASRGPAAGGDPAELLRDVARAVRAVVDAAGAGRDVALLPADGAAPGGVVVVVRGRPVGRAGLQHVVRRAHRTTVAAAELDLDELVAASAAPRGRAPAVPVRRSGPHPALTRDLTLDVPGGGPSALELLDVLRAAAPLVTDVRVVDSHVRDDHGVTRCLTFRLTLASPWRDVTRAEGNAVVAHAVTVCEGRGARVRR